MIALVTNVSTPTIDYRLVDITEDMKTVTILSSNEKFNFNHFFEVNQITHKLDDTISTKDALKLLESCYDPNWYQSQVDEGVLEESQLNLIKKAQDAQYSDIEYLKYTQ